MPSKADRNAVAARAANAVLEQDGVILAAQARESSADLLHKLVFVAREKTESPIAAALLNNERIGADGILKTLEEWWDKEAPPVSRWWGEEFRVPPWWAWALRVIAKEGKLSRRHKLAGELFKAPDGSEIIDTIWGSLLAIPDLGLIDLARLLFQLAPKNGQARVFAKALRMGFALDLLELSLQRIATGEMSLTVTDVWAAAMMSADCRRDDDVRRALRALTVDKVDLFGLRVSAVVAALEESALSDDLDLVLFLEIRYKQMAHMRLEPEDGLLSWLDKRFPTGVSALALNHAMNSRSAQFRQWALLSLSQRCHPEVQPLSPGSPKY